MVAVYMKNAKIRAVHDLFLKKFPQHEQNEEAKLSAVGQAVVLVGFKADPTDIRGNLYFRKGYYHFPDLHYLTGQVDVVAYQFEELLLKIYNVCAEYQRQHLANRNVVDRKLRESLVNIDNHTYFITSLLPTVCYKASQLSSVEARLTAFNHLSELILLFLSRRDLVPVSDGVNVKRLDITLMDVNRVLDELMLEEQALLNSRALRLTLNEINLKRLCRLLDSALLLTLVDKLIPCDFLSSDDVYLTVVDRSYNGYMQDVELGRVTFSRSYHDILEVDELYHCVRDFFFIPRMATTHLENYHSTQNKRALERAKSFFREVSVRELETHSTFPMIDGKTDRDILQLVSMILAFRNRLYVLDYYLSVISNIHDGTGNLAKVFAKNELKCWLYEVEKSLDVLQRGLCQLRNLLVNKYKHQADVLRQHYLSWMNNILLVQFRTLSQYMNFIREKIEQIHTSISSREIIEDVEDIRKNLNILNAGMRNVFEYDLSQPLTDLLQPLQNSSVKLMQVHEVEDDKTVALELQDTAEASLQLMVGRSARSLEQEFTVLDMESIQLRRDCAVLRRHVSLKDLLMQELEKYSQLSGMSTVSLYKYVGFLAEQPSYGEHYLVSTLIYANRLSQAVQRLNHYTTSYIEYTNQHPKFIFFRCFEIESRNRARKFCQLWQKQQLTLLDGFLAMLQQHYLVDASHESMRVLFPYYLSHTVLQQFRELLSGSLTSERSYRSYRAYSLAYYRELEWTVGHVDYTFNLDFHIRLADEFTDKIKKATIFSVLEDEHHKDGGHVELVGVPMGLTPLA